MTDSAPHSFISHASEDKERFVLEFATQLRARGIDAWLDLWELAPGDSLIDGILQRGIDASTSFVIVISKHSVEKPWVHKELNVALERAVAEGYRIIPVLLDGLTRDDVPTGLRDILWITHRGNVTETAEHVVRAILGTSSKPALGGQPAYLNGDVPRAHLLTDATDDLVLAAILDELTAAEGRASWFVGMTVTAAETLKKTVGLPIDIFDETVEALQQQGYLHLKRFFGHEPGKWLIDDVYLHTRLGYAASRNIDVSALALALVTDIMNNEGRRPAYTDFQGSPHWAVRTACDWLQAQGFLRYSAAWGGDIIVMSVEPLGRRWARQQAAS